jgi:hypothetical protein
MSLLTCQQIDERLDLHLDEPDPVVQHHIEQCARCQHQLDQARSLAGLLDLRFRADEGLARLDSRLREQRRPRRDFLRPILSLAAMLLVTFGLGWWLNPGSMSASPESPLHLSLAMGTDTRMVPMPMRGHENLAMLAAAAKVRKAKLLPVDLEGKSRRDWLEEIASGRKSDRLPLPPRINLEFHLSNPRDRPLHVRLDKQMICRLDVPDRGVQRRVAEADAQLPFTPQTVTIPVGGTLVLTWERLISLEERYMEYLYPLFSGDYSLQVHVKVVTWSDGETPRLAWLPSPGPITLCVSEQR